MPTIERTLAPVIADDGSIHYSSVMSPSDDSIAVCPMIPTRVIPVIFVPGIMGTNLKSKQQEPIWRVDSAAGVATDWVLASPKTRKHLLDPEQTEVDNRGALPSGTNLTEAEMRYRGWGEVAKMSYGTFLPWLENALNDFTQCKEGIRARLMKELVSQSPGVDLLTHDEVATSYRYQLPVHAVGYNWLQSNEQSSKRLKIQIDKFMTHYRDKRYMCTHVILVTHSMGGLVARQYSEVDNQRDSVLGIVHGVMPATGAATAYKRVKAGIEGGAGLVAGADSANVTAVFAQAPGPLQLLPTAEYGMGWLNVRDGAHTVSLPKRTPYEEIYLNRGKWWSLCDDALVNPLDERKKSVDEDWITYRTLVNDQVKTFHEILGCRYHTNTYAFYGDDKKNMAWGDIVWKRRTPRHPPPTGAAGLDDPLAGTVEWDRGIGVIQLRSASGGKLARATFDLQPAAENGDATVPIRSGRAPERHAKVCVPFADVDHEGAYKKQPQRLFALWAITKIAYSVRNTDMAYTS